MNNHYEHLGIHKGFDRLVADPLKYKGRGRPRKTDYVAQSELIKRHIATHVRKL